ncbi:hypothetical protein E1B28_005190 [Marasmius oreades]|uniref:Uncharacterized protein n=1 Tax=Marasmius oreades TaxID=181124 RepID=A0A9P7V082_9AGAR|nr:uncharacterized protein E1B28_005190 [Marasmius oreades]KAG7097879.1 hypothetical protein E1B28_005190 [Marasmius oreades]
MFSRVQPPALMTSRATPATRTDDGKGEAVRNHITLLFYRLTGERTDKELIQLPDDRTFSLLIGTLLSMSQNKSYSRSLEGASAKPGQTGLSSWPPGVGLSLMANLSRTVS